MPDLPVINSALPCLRIAYTRQVILDGLTKADEVSMMT